ncbi:MAG TPA: hypothetical protein VFS89_07315 [Nitrosospira sp.]|nr:hypothetical protein [Nitrosospira sp.]
MFRPYCKDNEAFRILITLETRCPGSFMGMLLILALSVRSPVLPSPYIMSHFQTMIHSELFEFLITLLRFSPANTNQ